jgi:hypothetical protein
MQIHVFVLQAPERCSGMKKRVHGPTDRQTDRQAAKLFSFICLQLTRHGHGQFVLFFYPHTTRFATVSVTLLHHHYHQGIDKRWSYPCTSLTTTPWRRKGQCRNSSTYSYLNLAARWRWEVISATPSICPLGKNPPSYNHWLEGWVGSQSWSAPCEKNNFLTLVGMEPWFLNRRGCSLVTIPSKFCLFVMERRKMEE